MGKTDADDTRDYLVDVMRFPLILDERNGFGSLLVYQQHPGESTLFQRNNHVIAFRGATDAWWTSKEKIAKMHERIDDFWGKLGLRQAKFMFPDLDVSELSVEVTKR